MTARERYLYLISALLLAVSNPLAAMADPDSGSESTAQSTDAMTKDDAQNSGTDITRPVNSFEVSIGSGVANFIAVVSGGHARIASTICASHQAYGITRKKDEVDR